MSRICNHCGNPFAPKTPKQLACSFKCARALVPKVDENDEEVTHLKVEDDREVRARRARRIEDALDELRKINASRLASRLRN